ncbi:putative RNA methyltransferase At5g10620 [Nymphaea colorata]|nr:putative RNA methyltransferase At5g10620 [Nymphaea colorata]
MAFPLCGNSRLSLMKNPHSPPHLGTRLARPYQSVKSLPVRLFTIGKKRSKGTQLLVEEYMEKLKSYCSVDDIQLKSNPKHTSDVKAQIDGEDLKIMHHIRSDDWVVVLDENGLDIGSEQMAEMVREAGNTGSSTLVFCIGGPYGHGEKLRKRADVTIRLSSMVLNHQIALIVLLEQIYRAWTILKGQKYHH